MAAAGRVVAEALRNEAEAELDGARGEEEGVCADGCEEDFVWHFWSRVFISLVLTSVLCDFVYVVVNTG